MEISNRRPGKFGPVILSTEDVPEAARDAYWRDMIRGPYPELGVDWLDERPIQARMQSCAFGAARVTEFGIRHAPVRVRRTPICSRDGFQLVLQLGQKGCYSHADREVVQETGDLVLLDNELPFDAMFPAGLRVLVWDLPREALAPLLASPGHAVARRFTADRGAAAVLKEYALTLANEADRLDAATQKILLLHLCNLAAVALGAELPSSEIRSVTHRTSRRQQILAFVEVHFRDQHLTAARAAADLKMSERWLHALFEEEAISFTAWVARRRVKECRKLLEDPALDHLSITEVAFHCGFNELSTFNRRFRAHYGMTPRDARRLRIVS